MYDISDKKAAIRAVQGFLLELHYFNNELPHIAIDGIYGDATREAVAAYQRLVGLPESGTVTHPTWERLYDDYQRAVAARESEGHIPPDTPLPVRMGATGTGVANLQHLQNVLAERYKLSVRTDTAGVYSYASEAVTHALRRIYRLEGDGSVDSALYEKMLRDYEYPALRD